MNLFDKKNVLLFHPEGIEFINDVLSSINHYNNYNSLLARRDGLRAINKLFELSLIEVFHWGKYEDELKGKKLSIFETMMYIQELWFIGAGFEDFAGMPMFKYKDWYLEALKRMRKYNDWITFVENEIHDMEKWIEENRPK